MSGPITRRRFTAGAAAAAAGATLLPISRAAFAQKEFPQDTVRFVIPFPAGGTTDIVGRIVADQLSQAWGVSVIADNRAGAGGNIGTQMVANEKPDGYTMLVCTVGTHGINTSLYRSLPYDAIEDFAPITRLATVPNIVVVHPSVKATTIQELIELLKANPGKFNYASSGNGTSIHLAAELFKTMTGTEMVHIPYKGSAPAIADLLGGQVQIMFDNLPSALPHVRSGKLRALAVTSAKRFVALPDLPTVAEAGVPGYEASSWFGLVAPAGTPAPIVDKTYQTVAEVLGKPAVHDQMIEQGAEPAPLPPAEFASFIKAEIDKWAKVVEAAGAQVD